MANEFVAKKGLISQGNAQVSGSLVVTNGVTASLLGLHVGNTIGSASYAETASSATSASWAPSNFNGSASYALTASFALNGGGGSSAGGSTYDVQINNSGSLSSASELVGSKYGSFLVMPYTASLTSALPAALVQQRDTRLRSYHATLYYSGSMYGVGYNVDTGFYNLIKISNPDAGLNAPFNATYQQLGFSNGMQMCQDGTNLYLITADGVSLWMFNLNIIAAHSVYTLPYNAGSQASICTDNTYLYVVTNNSPSAFYKHLLSDMSIVASASWSGVNGGHNIMVDKNNPQYVYATSLDGHISKINTSDLTYTSSFVGGIFTDDGLIQNGNLYLGNEALQIITVVNTSSFTYVTQSADQSYGIWGDGTNIFNGSTAGDGYFVVYPNGDLTKPYRFSLGFFCAPNELWITENGRLFFSNWYNNDTNIYEISPTLIQVGINTLYPTATVDVAGSLHALSISIGNNIVSQSNALNVNGNISASVVTASLFYGTASVAISASVSDFTVNSENTTNILLTGTSINAPFDVVLAPGAGTNPVAIDSGHAISYNPGAQLLVVPNLTVVAALNATASAAFSSSYAISSDTASVSQTTISSSYAISASCSDHAVSASHADNSDTASYAIQALTASYAGNVPLTASYALQSLNATSASAAINAASSSYVPNLYPQQYFPSSSWASQSLSASTANSASYLNPGSTFYLVSGSNGVQPAYIEPYDYNSISDNYLPPYKAGRMFWDNRYNDYGWYASTGSGATPFRMHIGKETTVGVHNPYPFTLPSLSAVYVGTSSVAGEYRPDVYFAIADGTGQSNVAGVIRNDIPSGSDGFMIMEGVMHRTNMGSFQVGDRLWLSPTIPGGMTTVKPGQPYEQVQLGYCSETGVMGSFMCDRNIQPPPPNAYAGITTPVIFTNNNDGTVTVSTASVNLFPDATGNGTIQQFPLLSATFTLATGSTNFITAQHSGSLAAQYVISTNAYFVNDINVVPIALIDVNKNGSDWELHTLDIDARGTALANRVVYKDVRLNGYQRQDGLTLYTTGSGTGFGVTAGNVWYGPTIHTLLDFVSQDTASCDTYHWVSSASVWTYHEQNGYDNYYYDNSNAGLQPLAPLSWSVNFIYRIVSDPDHPDVALVLSNTQYSSVIEASQLSSPPSNLPSQITDMGVLVGAIIVQSGSTSPTIVSAYAHSFVPATVTQHNSLLGLQGGTGGQYYHLSNAEYVGTGTGLFVRNDKPTFAGATPYHIPYWNPQQQLTLTGSVQVQQGQYVTINSASLDPNNPEALLVKQVNTSSTNIIGAYGSTDDFLQINVSNQTGSENASSDFIATNDIGTQSDYYIDMGINSSGYNNPDFTVQDPNGGYVYTNSGSLAIGTQTIGTIIKFHVDGTETKNIKAVIDSTGLHATGSLIGTASYAQNAIAITFVPSAATSASWVSASVHITAADSASYVPAAGVDGIVNSSSHAFYSNNAGNADTASYAASLSFIPVTAVSASWVSASAFITTAQTASFVTASKVVGVVLSASFSTTASYLLGNVTVTSVAFATQSLFSTQSIFATQSINAFSASWVSASAFITTAQTASYVTASNVTGKVSSASTSDTASSINFVPSSAASASWVSASAFITAAQTASYISVSNLPPHTASWSNTAISSVSATQSLFASQSINAFSASWVSASAFITTAQTASYVTASNIIGIVGSSSYALTASYLSNYAPTVSASWASSSLSSSYLSGSSGSVNILNLYPISTASAVINVVSQTNNTGSYSIGLGTWTNFPIPYIRGNSNTQIALDIMPGGGGQNSAWIDICDTDVVANNATNFESLNLRKNPSGNALISVHAGGTGIATRSLILQDNSGFIGFNTINPTEQYHAKFDQNARTTFVVENANSGSGAYTTMEVRNFTGSTDYLRLVTLGRGWTTNGAFVQDGGALELGPNLSGALSIITRHASSSIVMYQGGFASGNESLRISSTGIGIGGVTTPKNSLDVNGNISCSVITASLHFGTSSYAVTASRAITASYALGIPTIKAGILSASAFSGSPFSASVTFTTAFPNTIYSIAVTGEASRTYTVQQKSGSRFYINTNSSTPMTGSVYWQAMSIGEFYS